MPSGVSWYSLALGEAQERSRATSLALHAALVCVSGVRSPGSEPATGRKGLSQVRAAIYTSKLGFP